MFLAIFGEERIFPPEPGAKHDRQRVDRSFETILELAGIKEFRFHDLRHTFASWHMMNGGDLYELAKILGHANIKMPWAFAAAKSDGILLKIVLMLVATGGSAPPEPWCS